MKTFEIVHNIYSDMLIKFELFCAVSASDAKELHINIDSFGGDTDVMEKMVKEIKEAQKKGIKFYCHVSSWAASAAFVIMCACDYVTCEEYSKFMLHSASCGVFGNKNNMDNAKKVLEIIDDFACKVICDKSKQSENNIKNMLNQEIYLSPEECLQLGFVDSIKPYESTLSNSPVATATNNKKIEMCKINSVMPAVGSVIDNKNLKTENELNVYIQNVKEYQTICSKNNVVPDYDLFAENQTKAIAAIFEKNSNQEINEISVQKHFGSEMKKETFNFDKEFNPDQKV